MSESSQTSNRSQSRLRRYALAAALTWTAFIPATVGWNVFENRREMLDNARYFAQTSFQKEMPFRLWENGHGGGDAPATNNVPSNPRLSSEEHEVIISAPMMRQAQGHGQTQPGHRSHLAGLKPSRPGNEPDAWEAKALEAFKNGATEVSSVEMMAAQENMRVMRPLVTEAACLTRHLEQDEKVGDIRGGISVSVPLAPLRTHAQGQLASLVLGDGVIWLLGLGVIGFGARRVQVRDRERAVVAEALREAGQRYRTLFEQSPDAVLIVDPETTLPIEFNNRIPAISGYSREEFARLRIADYEAVEGQAETAAHIARIFQSGSDTFETQWRSKSGGLIDVLVSACVTEVGGKRVLQSVVRDVTERKQAEEAIEQSRAAALNMMDDAIAARDQAEQANAALRSEMAERKQAEEQLRKQAALLNAANDAIYVRALDGTVTFWNDGAERLYGWPRAEALGRKITELADVEHAAFEAAHAAIWEQGSWSGELRTTTKDGQERVVFCRWTLLRNEQSLLAEVLAINTDLTERKQLEAQFLRAQRMESIGALAGGIAHDVNNILAPILMSASLLKEMVNDPEGRKMLNTVEDCAQRGANIIQQLLIFARGQPGTRVPLPARHLLRDMIKLVRETFPRSIQARVRAPVELWPILGDATQIHQALMNLCVNARDAMPDGGTLTLAAENVTLDEVFAALTPDAKPGDYVCVSVTDTGTGIPPEHLHCIFDPFFTTKEIGKGTGLGLATVLGIVRGHGGFVRVDSRVGQGTTFKLYLPVSPEARAAAPPDDDEPPPRGQGELILVVDDEPSLREMVQRTLEKHGYRVVTAAEGNAALALFASHRAEIRAVLTDLMMAGMDGPRLVRALRNMEAELPILGMTGLAERTAFQELEALRLAEVLTKPFTTARLLAVLHQALAAAGGVVFPIAANTGARRCLPGVITASCRSAPRC